MKKKQIQLNRSAVFKFLLLLGWAALVWACSGKLNWRFKTDFQMPPTTGNILGANLLCKCFPTCSKPEQRPPQQQWGESKVFQDYQGWKFGDTSTSVDWTNVATMKNASLKKCLPITRQEVGWTGDLPTSHPETAGDRHQLPVTLLGKAGKEWMEEENHSGGIFPGELSESFSCRNRRMGALMVKTRSSEAAEFTASTEN